MFRKPWTQHEKLAYPVIQAPMLLFTQTQALFQSRLFWIGFAAVALLDVINGLHYFYPAIPEVSVVHVANIQSYFPDRPWRDMGPMVASFYPFAIGLCFFMPLDLGLFVLVLLPVLSNSNGSARVG